jgi:hypothetical protein
VRELGLVVITMYGSGVFLNFVDLERWTQILNVRDTARIGEISNFIAWLTCDNDPDTTPPKGAPERQGHLISSICASDFRMKSTEIEGHIIGVLTVPL